MTLQRRGGAAAFSSSARAYEATMSPALWPVASEVVGRAALAPGERVLDIGTGTGNAAAIAVGEGRRVIGLDAAAGMLQLARAKVPAAEFVEADFSRLPFPEATFDVVVSVHALLFAEDRVAALREWRRVLRRGGRLSLSVPGPPEAVPMAVLHPVYDRYGITWSTDHPNRADLAAWAARAGWEDVVVDADPGHVIPLADEDLFETWLRVGARGRATAGWSDNRRRRFAADLMAASPRGTDGEYRLPFGALFLAARRPQAD